MVKTDSWDHSRNFAAFGEFLRRAVPEFLVAEENAIVFFHSQGLAVLCIRNSGFTLTNGVVSYAMDRQCPHKLFKFLHYLNVGTICVTDQHSKQTFKDIQASWSSSSPFKRTPVMLLNSNGRELGQCPFFNQTTCHRWIAVQGMCAILHQPIKPLIVPPCPSFRIPTLVNRIPWCVVGEKSPPMIVTSTFCWNRWCFKNECCTANPPNKIGGNFKKWKRIFTPGHADDGRK
ncbi:hypothetical protein TNCV_294241 [Trichonephila clavipes]|nr:hypothetical protein TNCV_294241 [Trichonephila clavipes]